MSAFHNKVVSVIPRAYEVTNTQDQKKSKYHCFHLMRQSVLA